MDNVQRSVGADGRPDVAAFGYGAIGSRHIAEAIRAGEVRLDGCVRVVGLQLLHGLASRETERSIGERRDCALVAGLGEDGEGARIEVVARGLRGVRSVDGPGGRQPASIQFLEDA